MIHKNISIVYTMHLKISLYSVYLMIIKLLIVILNEHSCKSSWGNIGKWKIILTRKTIHHDQLEFIPGMQGRLVHKMEYYSEIEIKELLIHTGTKMNFKIVLISENGAF